MDFKRLIRGIAAWVFRNALSPAERLYLLRQRSFHQAEIDYWNRCAAEHHRCGATSMSKCFRAALARHRREIKRLNARLSS
jgi:glycyl-tRNA synthetase (class II)